MGERTTVTGRLIGVLLSCLAVATGTACDGNGAAAQGEPVPTVSTTTADSVAGAMAVSLGSMGACLTTVQDLQRELGAPRAWVDADGAPVDGPTYVVNGFTRDSVRWWDDQQLDQASERLGPYPAELGNDQQQRWLAALGAVRDQRDTKEENTSAAGAACRGLVPDITAPGQTPTTSAAAATSEPPDTTYCLASFTPLIADVAAGKAAAEVADRAPDTEAAALIKAHPHGDGLTDALEGYCQSHPAARARP